MKNTFGNSKASYQLEKLVESNPSVSRKISALLARYSHQMLLVSLIPDEETGLLCMELLKNHTISLLLKKNNIPLDVGTYTKNIIIARYRKFTSGYREVSKMRKSVSS